MVTNWFNKRLLNNSRYDFPMGVHWLGNDGSLQFSPTQSWCIDWPHPIPTIGHCIGLFSTGSVSSSARTFSGIKLLLLSTLNPSWRMRAMFSATFHAVKMSLPIFSLSFAFLTSHAPPLAYECKFCLIYHRHGLPPSWLFLRRWHSTQYQGLLPWWKNSRVGLPWQVDCQGT